VTEKELRRQELYCNLVGILALILLIIGFLNGCTKERQAGVAQPSPAPTAKSCETYPFRLPARNAHKHFNYPLEGVFAEESHGLTREQTIADGIDGWPKTRQQGMDEHLKLHAPILARYGLQVDRVYDHSTTEMSEGKLPYRRVWTGKNDKGQYAGMWSRKDKPTIEAETWTFNQAWTFESAKDWYKGRFLLCAKGRCVVGIAHENGPSDTKWMGGVQPAIARYLDVKNTEKIRVSRLVDQQVPLGPVECK
jgi:hypothetical protein